MRPSRRTRKDTAFSPVLNLEILEVVRRAPLDGGLACESIDPQTGGVRTGAAMASLAGFLAWALWARLQGHRRFFERLLC